MTDVNNDISFCRLLDELLLTIITITISNVIVVSPAIFSLVIIL